MMTLFAEISEAGWVNIITAIFAGITTVTGAVTTVIVLVLKAKSARIEQKADDAKEAARTAVVVASDTQASVGDKLDALATNATVRAEVAEETLAVAKEVHTLTNGATGVLLATVADLTGRLAAQPDATSEDRKAATDATEVSDRHRIAEGRIAGGG